MVCQVADAGTITPYLFGHERHLLGSIPASPRAAELSRSTIASSSADAEEAPWQQARWWQCPGARPPPHATPGPQSMTRSESVRGRRIGRPVARPAPTDPLVRVSRKWLLVCMASLRGTDPRPGERVTPQEPGHSLYTLHHSSRPLQRKTRFRLVASLYRAGSAARWVPLAISWPLPCHQSQATRLRLALLKVRPTLNAWTNTQKGRNAGSGGCPGTDPLEGLR